MEAVQMPLLSPLARHFDSIFSAARVLMVNQNAQSIADLVSTRQFVAHGTHHRHPRRVEAVRGVAAS
jgi:hypothetical protein